MAFFNNLALLATVGTLTLSLAANVYAVDEDVEAEAEFRQALALTLVTDIDFTPGTDVIEFTGTPATADVINLATSGAITTGGTAFSAPSTGTVGNVSIAGANGLAVEVSCTDTATISDGTNSLTVGSLEIVMDTGVALGGAGVDDCEGLGVSPLVHTLDGTDNVLMGGIIEGGSGTVTTAVYNTGNTGGTAATIRVLYQ